eukprot:g2172.t1
MDSDAKERERSRRIKTDARKLREDVESAECFGGIGSQFNKEFDRTMKKFKVVGKKVEKMSEERIVASATRGALRKNKKATERLTKDNTFSAERISQGMKRHFPKTKRGAKCPVDIEALGKASAPLFRWCPQIDFFSGTDAVPDIRCVPDRPRRHRRAPETDKLEYKEPKKGDAHAKPSKGADESKSTLTPISDGLRFPNRPTKFNLIGELWDTTHGGADKKVKKAFSRTVEHLFDAADEVGRGYLALEMLPGKAPTLCPITPGPATSKNDRRQCIFSLDLDTFKRQHKFYREARVLHSEKFRAPYHRRE